MAEVIGLKQKGQAPRDVSLLRQSLFTVAVLTSHLVTVCCMYGDHVVLLMSHLVTVCCMYGDCVVVLMPHLVIVSFMMFMVIVVVLIAQSWSLHVVCMVLVVM